jgi:glycosyltransferase involved in cell wall biosynthesis
MKILFYATHYSQPIGYARVAHKLVNCLSSEGHEVYYFAITNYEHSSTRSINSNIKIIDALKQNEKDPYGFSSINDIIKAIKPDIFFIYNDIIVTCNLLNRILNTERSFKIITYLDLVFDYERHSYLKFIDSNVEKIIVFSDYWKNNLARMDINPNKIHILPHGIDDCFRPLDKQKCRMELNLEKDDFIVFNTNRNSYRKALDITIKAFLLFLKNNNFDKRIKLYLNCYLNTPNGYDIPELTRTECVKMGLDYIDVLNNHVFKYSSNEGGITDEVLNKLYCATDVGINTCLGEGFGLCNLEHLSLGVPQITSRVGALTDFIPDEMTVEPKVSISASNILDEHNGDLRICDYKDFSDKIQSVYKGELTIDLDVDELRKRYTWDTILRDFKNIIQV